MSFGFELFYYEKHYALSKEAHMMFFGFTMDKTY